MVEGEYLKLKWDWIEGKSCNMQVSRSVVMEGVGFASTLQQFPRTSQHGTAELRVRMLKMPLVSGLGLSYISACKANIFHIKFWMQCEWKCSWICLVWAPFLFWRTDLDSECIALLLLSLIYDVGKAMHLANSCMAFGFLYFKMYFNISGV